MRFGRKVLFKVSIKTETWHVVPGEGRMGVRERVCFHRVSRRPLPTRVGHTNQHVVFRRRIRVQCSDRVRVLIDI